LFTTDTDETIDQEFKEFENRRINSVLKEMITNRDQILSCYEDMPLIIDEENVGEMTRFQVKKESVHKKEQKNVMIKKLLANESNELNIFIGNSSETSEISLDHIHRGHVEAIYLSEICRQAGMETLNQKIGNNATYYISQEVKKYQNKVNREEDVIVETLPIIGTKKRGFGLCLYSLFQNHEICMSGYYLVAYSRGTE
ncbi:hypothetical protein EPJ63_08935, partial [Pediococcus acidilactici]